MNGIHEDEPSSTVLDGWFADYKADVLVVGHTHAPLERRANSGGLVLNPGTLMREAKCAPEAALLFDRAMGKFVRREPELASPREWLRLLRGSELIRRCLTCAAR